MAQGFAKNPPEVFTPDKFGNAGRLRVSDPDTIFDSKQLEDNQPLFWDDQQVSGSGTSSTFSQDNARSRLSVSATTAGVRTRQTFMRFNYQPGKSQLMLLAGVLNAAGGGAGIVQQIGMFNDGDGIFLQNNEGTIQLVRRTSTSGSPVDNTVDQSSWNIDTFDGTGPSGITLDFTKMQVFAIDLEWLGGGNVRLGFMVDGGTYFAHEFLHANILNTVYISTPNLPLRYSISNDGTGAASSLDHTAASVISEGGAEKTGHLTYLSTNGVHVDANTADALYAIVGYRLKSTALSATIETLGISMITETNDDFEWSLLLNPIVAGTFTYSDVTNSALQKATGASTNTVTGGFYLDGGYGKSSIHINDIIKSTLRVGVSINGTRDTIVLCARPLSSNSDIQGSITVRERN